MTIEELNKYKLWVDKSGNVWELQYYILGPSAGFKRMSSQPISEDEIDEISGGIDSWDLSELEPIKHPKLEWEKAK